MRSTDLSPDLLPPGSRVLCALSGGADSMCLLHMLSQRKDLSLTAAHFNHQLRGPESDEDEAFVRDVCARWGIPLTVDRGDVGALAQREGLSTEEAGRILRYAFLEEAARKEGCDLIATAHNADDNAEAMLLSLIRGTGLAGLSGIPPRRGNIVRPLLSFTRSEILAYLEEHNIPHREDSSNADEAYARNRLRAQVMPVLRQLNPRASEHILQTARRVRELDDGLEEEARQLAGQGAVTEGRVSIPLKLLHSAPAALAPRIILQLLDMLKVGRKDFGAVHLEAVLALKEGGQLHLPHSVTARRQKGSLIMELRADPLPETALLPGEPLAFGPYTLTLLDTPQGEGLPLSIPQGSALTVGPCPLSARLTLPGAKGSRTVKRLCLDLHVPPAHREGLPAIFVDRRLAAVWPLGTDQAFLPEGAPRRFIQIKQDRREKT